MDNPWEESLDLKDPTPLSPLRHNQSPPSTLPSFLQRCTQTHFSSPLRRRIPGPAGNVQEAIHRRKNRSEVGLMNQDIIPTQEYIRRVVEDGNGDNDDDFTRNPWLLALHFIRSQGMVAGDGAIGVPLSAIKSRVNVYKVAQVVAIVKSCALNGLGGMMVTLKDPTDTIDASIHQGVLTDKDFGKRISIGAVIILQKVTVFSPTRSACYLNITLNNVVKVISKNEEILHNQHCSALRDKQIVSTSEHVNTSQQMPQIQASLSNERTEVIMSNLRRNAGSSLSINGEIQMEEIAMRSRLQCDRSDGTLSDQHCSASRVKQIASSSEHVDISQMPQIHAFFSSGRTEAIVSSPRQNAFSAMNERSDCQMEEMAVISSHQGDGSNGSQDVFATKGMSQVIHDGANGRKEAEVESHEATSDKDNGKVEKENRDTSESEQRLPVISRTSLPQWTDEQLDELFAFD